MIAIADCGGTTCEWRIKTDKGIEQLSSAGFNPVIMPYEPFVKNLKEKFVARESVSQLVFYCAGTIGAHLLKTSKALENIFPNATITVETDLLASARALFAKEDGIACILGTGSNSALFQSGRIVQNTRSLGFLLGDEGSGSHLGKKLLQAAGRGQLPPDLLEALELYSGASIDGTIESVYTADFPNQRLASFADFLASHKNRPEIYLLVYHCFSDFITEHIKSYRGWEQLTASFSGSIAYYFSDILRKSCSDNNIKTGRIIQKPIASLSLYHKLV